jgi:hypothetical protein
MTKKSKVRILPLPMLEKTLTVGWGVMRAAIVAALSGAAHRARLLS